MAKRQFSLTDIETVHLRQAYLTAKDGPTRTRYQAVRLYGLGYSVAHVGEITGCSRTSLLEWCVQYRTTGLVGLVDGRVGGNRAKLTREQRARVRVRLHQYTPCQLFGAETATPSGQFWTIPDLQRAVALWFGVTWNSPSSYRSLLSDCGFSYQRGQNVFKTRSETQGMAFEEQIEKN